MCPLLSPGDCRATGLRPLPRASAITTARRWRVGAPSLGPPSPDRQHRKPEEHARGGGEDNALDSLQRPKMAGRLDLRHVVQMECLLAVRDAVNRLFPPGTLTARDGLARPRLSGWRGGVAEW